MSEAEIEILGQKLSEEVKKAERQRQTLTQAELEPMDRKLIFSQTYSFFLESDPTIVASSQGLIIQQSHCA